jgi:hypothetical protein
MMPKKKVNDYNTGIPQQHIEALARCLLPQIEKFFESAEGQREFEEWKNTQSLGNKTKTAKA